MHFAHFDRREEQAPIGTIYHLWISSSSVIHCLLEFRADIVALVVVILNTLFEGINTSRLIGILGVHDVALGDFELSQADKFKVDQAEQVLVILHEERFTMEQTWTYFKLDGI